MRLSAGLLWFLLVAAGALVGVVLLASTAPAERASCDVADRTKGSHLVAQAQNAYAAILKEEPDSACAANGMDAVITERCERGDRLRGAGLKEEARDVYTAIITADLPAWNGDNGPDWDVGCAIHGLRALGPEEEAKPCPCLRGRRGRRGRRGKRGPPGRVVYVHKCKSAWHGED